MPGVFVAGTGSGVGKTAVAAGLVAALRERGIQAAGFKPVETGWDGPDGALPPQAACLQAASGLRLQRGEVVPYALSERGEPALAAARQGIAIDVQVIERAYDLISRRCQMVVVDGCGGLATPLVTEPWFCMSDLAFTWGMPILVVAQCGAGAANQAVLTVEHARRKGLNVVGLVVNDYAEPPAERADATPQQLAAMTGLPLLGVLPHRDGVDVAAGKWQPMAGEVGKRLELWRIQAILQMAKR